MKLAAFLPVFRRTSFITNLLLSDVSYITLYHIIIIMIHIVSNTRKYDSGLSRFDVTDRVRFKLAVLMYQSLHGTVSPYLMDSCTLTAEVTGRQHLRSATQRKLVVPRYRLNSFGRRRFSVAGPSTWNLLPDSLRDPELSLSTFKCQLNTYFLAKC